MDSILASLCWDSEPLPLPGSHSTLSENDFLPWQCISEVMPGLYLTCASEVADKARCATMGMALVINMCGEAHVSKYRVFDRDGDAAYAFRRVSTQADFFRELDDYCGTAVSTPEARRKVFVVTIPAEDTPTYNIDEHFLECAVLMEIVLRARKDHDSVSGEDYFSVPAVAVHCLVGVSRSASIVIAYLVKKYGVSRDEAMEFIRCTRPVVQPNPGFQRQLTIWETLGSCRIVDEWSAKVLALEIKAKSNLVELVGVVLPTILRTSKCDRERRFFGPLISSSAPTEAELHAVYRELRASVAADVDSEVYTDVPNYFGYVAEVVCSIDRAVPAVLRYATDFCSSCVYNDAFYYRVAKDVARSGFEKDPCDTTRGFCSLFEAIHLKHLGTRDTSRPTALTAAAGEEELPSYCGLSFPFLFLVAPYAEGFVQFSEWSVLTDAFPTTGDTLGAADVRRLKGDIVQAFLQFFFQSSCASEDSAVTQSYTKLGFLQQDAEVATFRSMAAEHAATGAPASSLDRLVALPQANDEHVAFLHLCKVLSGVLAFRLVLEAAEQLFTQTYSVRLGEATTSLADELLPLPAVSAAATALERAYTAAYCRPCKASSFFSGELSSLLETGVLNAAGVVSVFQETV
ncbi:putative dual-specificity protein phosphatase [Novymonas esmeraldas]|uniref:Dual-specificity protein phosphatase n=1 Tax=Novymonas esmeraldas TaxID=1808958 RepID=A0AAW0F401_9TRYP